VKHLRRGCLSVSRAEDGRIYRRKVSSPGIAARAAGRAPRRPIAALVLKRVQESSALKLARLRPGMQADVADCWIAGL
jgi:hypothetical protein